MAKFGGVLSLDQLSPEVKVEIERIVNERVNAVLSNVDSIVASRVTAALSNLNALIDARVSEALENFVPRAEAVPMTMGGLVAIGLENPNNQDVDVWFQPETAGIDFTSLSENIIVTTDINSVNNPETGSTIVEIEPETQS